MTTRLRQTPDSQGGAVHLPVVLFVHSANQSTVQRAEKGLEQRHWFCLQF